jgi:hypothetical protein
MPWDRSQPTDPKYRTREHKQYRTHLLALLKQHGYLTCTANTCHLPTRTITNPNGSHNDGLTAGHADNGVDYDGPQHRTCNTKDGAKRARARQNRPMTWDL